MWSCLLLLSVCTEVMSLLFEDNGITPLHSICDFTSNSPLPSLPSWLMADSLPFIILKHRFYFCSSFNHSEKKKLWGRARCYTLQQCRYVPTCLFLENLKYSWFPFHHHKMDFTVLSNRGNPDDLGSVGEMKGMFLRFWQQSVLLKVISPFVLFLYMTYFSWNTAVREKWCIHFFMAQNKIYTWIIFFFASNIPIIHGKIYDCLTRMANYAW